MYCLLRSCFQKCVHLIRKIKLKYVCICIGLVAVLDFFGVFTHMFEITYDSNFVYPYEGDIHEFVNALRHNEKPVVDPINDYNFSFLIDNHEKCIETPRTTFRVVYIVKSAIEHFERRSAIRNSWGFEKRFFDVPSKTVFMLGISPSDEIQAKVKVEAATYKDIIQANFIDTYYNNTIKTMMSFKWLIKRCLNSKFYMFVDDDIYVSVKNVLRFIRNPTNYPSYLKEPKKFEAHKREIKDSDIREEPYINDTVIQRNVHILNKHDLPMYNNLKEKITAEKIIHGSEEKSLYNSLNTIPSIITNFTEKDRDSNKTMMNEPFRVKRQIFDFELPEDVRLFAGFVFVSSPHRHKSSKCSVSCN
ncbi:beta-1,3-galactosyltransferase brn isoform X3 [Megachile rotundata]|uniref:beta-1,3-galactosyltransferase brn isoform X3 n=1 Tax=Megachile rotundata TaxID=143995 RepID=UPI003FD15F4E